MTDELRERVDALERQEWEKSTASTVEGDVESQLKDLGYLE